MIHHNSIYFHMVSGDLPWFSPHFPTCSHPSPVGPVGSATPQYGQRLTKGIRQLSRELPQGQEDEGHHRIPGPLDLRKLEDMDLLDHEKKSYIFDGKKKICLSNIYLSIYLYYIKNHDVKNVFLQLEYCIRIHCIVKRIKGSTKAGYIFSALPST
jgi:hypothetical protein